VISAGPYTNHLHLAPDRYPFQHLIFSIFLQPDALPDAQPTVSKKAKIMVEGIKQKGHLQETLWERDYETFWSVLTKDRLNTHTHTLISFLFCSNMWNNWKTSSTDQMPFLSVTKSAVSNHVNEQV